MLKLSHQLKYVPIHQNFMEVKVLKSGVHQKLEFLSQTIVQNVIAGA